MHLIARTKAGVLSSCAALLFCVSAQAQISLATAVNLALGNDQRVRLAQADVAKAQAVLAQSKDAFVPALAATGGVGKSTGAPLSPPVVFSVAAQSLVYNAAQHDYVRAARAGVESAQLALDAVRSDVAEDVANTYVTLDNALERRGVQEEALGFSGHLVRITEERFEAGVDAHLELTKAKRSEAQIRLQQVLIDGEIATQTEHLAALTGLSARGLSTVHGSIPTMQAPAPSAAVEEISGSAALTGTSAAFSAARARQFTARGDTHYLLRPQVAFAANYARIATAFTNYEQYYPRFGANNNSFNSLSIGVQLTLPILDMVHRAKARETAADAAHSLAEARIQQITFFQSRSKLRRTAAELQARRDLAGLEHDLAQDQLEAVTARLQAAAANVGTEQLTPKDEANARLGERQRQLDILNAALQLAQTEVMLMRQEGTLANWLAASLPSSLPASSTPTTTVTGQPARDTPAISGVGSALPATVGSEPATSPPGAAAPGAGPESVPGSLPNSVPSPPSGSAPTPVPTTGMPPTSLPSAPVTAPAPQSAAPQPGAPPQG